MANSFLSSSDLMNVLIPIHSARIDSLLEFFLGQSHMHMLVISRSKAKCNHSPGLFPRNSLHNLRQQSRDASRKSVFGVLLNLWTTPSFSKCPIRIEVSNHQKQKSTPLGSDWRVFDWTPLDDETLPNSAKVEASKNETGLSVCFQQEPAESVRARDEFTGLWISTGDQSNWVPQWSADQLFWLQTSHPPSLVREAVSQSLSKSSRIKPTTFSELTPAKNENWE